MALILLFLGVTKVLNMLFGVCDLSLDKSDGQRNRITGECASDTVCKKPFWNMFLYKVDETCGSFIPNVPDVFPPAK